MQKVTHKTKWTKMSGAGNCFWITHFPTTPPQSNNWIKTAQVLCRNNADGLVVLLPSKVCDFKWLFYNADGSSAEMCGNAACCVTDYVFKKHLLSSKKNSLTLETFNQKITGTFKDGSACIFLKKSIDIRGPFEMDEYDQEPLSYMFINSSVPHAVIQLTQWPNNSKVWGKQKAMGQILRKNTTHHKDGMNVSFYYPKKTLLSKIQLLARSFERGVEDFTPACGTGALAVAQVYRQYAPNVKSIFIEMPGGTLEVGFHSDNTLSLISPVEWITEIEEKEIQ